MASVPTVAAQGHPTYRDLTRLPCVVQLPARPAPHLIWVWVTRSGCSRSHVTSRTDTTRPSALSLTQELFRGTHIMHRIAFWIFNGPKCGIVHQSLIYTIGKDTKGESNLCTACNDTENIIHLATCHIIR